MRDSKPITLASLLAVAAIASGGAIGEVPTYAQRVKFRTNERTSDEH